MSGDSADATKQSETHLLQFLEWMKTNDFQLSPKLEVRFADELSNLGAFATSPISAGEILFVVPRPMILSHSTSSISQKLQEHADDLDSDSGWLLQILALMYERVVDPSKWRPYLQVAPNFGDHRLPLQWTSDERQQLLKGTGLVETVEEDLRKMEAEWEHILIPFVRKHQKTFAAAEFQSLDFFKETVAFIMAYSFTEPADEDDEEDESETGEKSSLPYMVPMADILNHSACNNAEVQYKAERLEIRAIKDIATGEEIFNTYGVLSNWELLHCYGFALPPHQLREAEAEAEADSVPLCIRPELGEERFAALRKAGLVSVGASSNLAFNGDGFVNPESAAIILTVFSMSQEEYETRMAESESEEGSWIACLEEELEDEVEYLVQRSCFPKLPQRWRRVLRDAADRRLKSLPKVVESEANVGKSSMEIFANRVCQSQRDLLHELLLCVPT